MPECVELRSQPVLQAEYEAPGADRASGCRTASTVSNQRIMVVETVHDPAEITDLEPEHGGNLHPLVDLAMT